ncbi:MAG: integrase core domain-containing protein, partial [Bacteroidota bacterium]
ENAYAERINRTIKEEYLEYKWISNFSQLKASISRAVFHYNNFRPHDNLKKIAPMEFIQKWIKTNPKDKPKILIFDDSNN